MRPTAHLPTSIALTALLVCLIAAGPAAARRPAQAVVSSAAIDAVTAKAPCVYESFWPLVLWKTPSVAVFRPSQLVGPIRKTPRVQIFRPEQILQPSRKRPSRPIFRPHEIVEPVRKTPRVQIFRPAQIGR